MRLPPVCTSGVGAVLKNPLQYLIAACLLCGKSFGQEVDTFSESTPQGFQMIAAELQYSEADYGTHQLSPYSPPSNPVSVVSDRESIRLLQDEVSYLKSHIQQVQYSPAIESSLDGKISVGNSACEEGCGSGCCHDVGFRWQSPRLFESIEVPFLQPRISGAFPVFNVSPTADHLINADYTAALRYQAEFRSEPTLGIRGRYFTFDSNSPFAAPFQPAEFGIRVDTAELEFVFHKAFCRLNVDMSAGVQYGRLEYSATTPTAVGVGSVRFEGVGPVFAMNAEHQLGDSRLSLFGGTRASFLMGEIRNAALLVNVPRSTIHDEMMQVYQNQLGMVWKPQLFDQVDIAVKAGWETQFWLNDVLADDSYGIGSNLSLTGPMVSLEATF